MPPVAGERRKKVVTGTRVNRYRTTFAANRRARSVDSKYTKNAFVAGAQPQTHIRAQGTCLVAENNVVLSSPLEQLTALSHIH